MFTFLDKTTYGPLVVAAIILGLAPFTPIPHALEKLTMLVEGRLSRPIDIFDRMKGTRVMLGQVNHDDAHDHRGNQE